MPVPYSPDEVKRSKSASIRDGACWAVSLGSGEAAVQPFVVNSLGADFGLTALLTSVPAFIGSLAQFIAAPALSSLRERRLFSTLVLVLQSLTWLCMAYLAVSGQPWAALAAVAVFCVYNVFNLLVSPVWNVWMSEIVQAAERGYYFALRNRIIVLLQATITLLVGVLLLQTFLPLPQIFALIFLTAFLSRLGSGYFLSQMADHPPERGERAERGLDLGTFLTNPSLREERHFSLYILLLLAAAYLTSSFYTFYLLRVLHADYLGYFLVILAAPLAKFLTFPFWGKINDRWGTRTLLYICGLLVPIGPAIWFLTPNVAFLVFAEFLAGIAWAGFDLATFNYLLSHPDARARLTISSVYNLCRGTGILLGALGAILLYTYWPASASGALLGLSVFSALFLFSSVGRLIISLLFLPRFSKTAFERQLQSSQFIVEVLAVRPTRDLSRNLVSGSMSSLHHAQSEMDFGMRLLSQGLDRAARLLRPLRPPRRR